MGRVLLAVAVGGLCLSSLASAARADDILVPGDYRTLAEAVDAASPGDRILVRSRRQRGPIVVRTPGIEIVGNRTTIRSRYDRDNPRHLTVEADGVTVRGFRFRRLGVLVKGSGVTIEENEFRRPRGAGVLWSLGDGTTVRGNDLSRVEGIGFGGEGGVIVQADGALVEGNRVSRTVRSDGIRVVGDGAVVRGNEVDFVAAGAGIFVRGSGFSIERNRLTGVGQIAGARVMTSDPGIGGGNGPKWNTFRACPGIQVVATGPGGTVSGNAVEHAASEGYDLVIEGAGVTDNDETFIGEENTLAAGVVVRGEGNAVTGNRLDGGSLELLSLGDWERVDGEYAWVVVGGSNLVTGNRVAGVRTGFHSVVVEGDGNLIGDNEVLGPGPDGGAGYWITGSGNTLRDNRVEGAAGFGFHVGAETTGNFLEGCTATGTVGCGLENLGAASRVTGGTFLRSGVVDIRNRGTFDLFEGNTFETGSPDPVPGTGENTLSEE